MNQLPGRYNMSGRIQSIHFLITFLLSLGIPSLSCSMPNNPFNYLSVQILSTVSNPKNIELGVQVHPYDNNFPALHLTFSSDWIFDDYVTDQRYVTSFGVGMGGTISFSRFHFTPGFGYLYQSGFDIRRYNRTPEFINHAWYFSLESRIHLPLVFLDFKARQFLDNIVLINDQTRYLINIGIGFYLR